MPKIHIKEYDKTTSGTPGDYSNHNVLIAGFKGKPTASTVKPDSNGVYEFSSADDFEKNIGLRAPKITGGAAGDFYHYGNQMAYELLNMGYQIIYLPLDNINEVVDESKWEIFKDKANYDFRFITHGLLASNKSSENEEQALVEAEAEFALINSCINEYLNSINNIKSVQEADGEVEETSDRQDAYTELLNKLQKDAQGDDKDKANKANAIHNILKTYLYFDDNTDAEGKDIIGAWNGIQNEKVTLENEIKNLKANLDSASEGAITPHRINQANSIIANLATFNSTEGAYGELELPGRGDCVALIELDENSYISTTTTDKPEKLIAEATKSCTFVDDATGPFCTMTVPSVVYYMDEDDRFDNNKKFPGAFHYLACFKSSLNKGFREWYAAAGYTRGVASYVIDYTTVKLGEVAINTLEPRYLIDNENAVQPKFACNVIANFRGSYYLWGNRTAKPLGSAKGSSNNDLRAQHFLNIRHLCTTIKKQLYVACRRFTFDPNSDTLWYNFVGAIRPTLETMKADQGIREYKILKVFTDKKATLKAKIRIVPIEAVEDFDIEIYLEDSIGGATVTVNE